MWSTKTECLLQVTYKKGIYKYFFGICIFQPNTVEGFQQLRKFKHHAVSVLLQSILHLLPVPSMCVSWFCGSVCLGKVQVFLTLLRRGGSLGKAGEGAVVQQCCMVFSAQGLQCCVLAQRMLWRALPRMRKPHTELTALSHSPRPSPRTGWEACFCGPSTPAATHSRKGRGPWEAPEWWWVLEALQMRTC